MILVFGLFYGVLFVDSELSGDEVLAAENYGIMPLATVAPSASLTVGGGSSASLTGSAAPGGMIYANTNVAYSAVDTTAYTLQVTYANGYSSLKQDGSTNTIAAVGTTGKTGSSMANTNSNAWGFAWSDNTSTANDTLTYYTMPAYGTKGSGISTGRIKNGTSAASTTGKIVFAARFASNNTNAGHYRTQVLLSLTATPKATYNYSLAYDMNGGTGTIATQTANSQDTTSYTFTITSTKPTRTGYDFLGWADANNATTAQYSSGGTITVQSSAPSKTVYAVWKAQLSLKTLVNMQDMTPEICTAAVIGDSNSSVKDARDNSIYSIAKLADGKCWMTQNLRITRESIKAKTSSNTTGKITFADSNVGTTVTTGNNYELPASSLSWSVVSGGNSYTGTEGVYYNNDTTYGAYYSWYTATTGTTAEIATGDASYDICPKGWRLPTGGTGSDFNTLSNIYPNTAVPSTFSTLDGKSGYWIGGTNVASGGAFFPAAGYIVSGGLDTYGPVGYYWSSTADGGNNAQYLKLRAGDIHSDDSRDKYSGTRNAGYSVRCIAK